MRYCASWFTVIAFLAPVATLAGCSDSASSGNGASATGDASGDVGGGCSGAFCLEDDVRIELTPSSLTFLDLEACSGDGAGESQVCSRRRPRRCSAQPPATR